MSEMTPPNAIDMQHTIDRLTAQLKEMKEERDKEWGIEYCCSGAECGCRGLPIHPPPWWEEMNNQLATSRADAAGLREALEKIATPCTIVLEIRPLSAHIDMMGGIARKALAASGKEK